MEWKYSLNHFLSITDSVVKSKQVAGNSICVVYHNGGKLIIVTIFYQTVQESYASVDSPLIVCYAFNL
jgi:hypothetical protein